MALFLTSGNIGESARNAADRAMHAKEQAIAAEEKVTEILDNLPEDELKAEQIPIDIDEANRDIQRAKVQGMQLTIVDQCGIDVTPGAPFTSMG